MALISSNRAQSKGGPSSFVNIFCDRGARGEVMGPPHTETFGFLLHSDVRESLDFDLFRCCDTRTISVFAELSLREFLEVKLLMVSKLALMESAPMLQVCTSSAWAAEPTWRMERAVVSRLRLFKRLSITRSNKMGPVSGYWSCAESCPF